nr:CotH kinase family protein [Eubacterium sp.]
MKKVKMAVSMLFSVLILFVLVLGLKSDSSFEVYAEGEEEEPQHGIPVLYFNIDESKGTIEAMNQSPDHTAECYGSVTIKVPEGYKSEYSDQTAEDMYDLELEYIRGRGTSSWIIPDKKPYKMKFDKGQDLFGMGKNKHWVLLANAMDNTFLRNKITYKLGEELGMDYVMSSIPVEVVMNGRYYGLYYLCEHVRIGKTRIAIDELEEKDTSADKITGGYL